MKRNSFFYLCCLLIAAACQTETEPALKPLDLLQYDIPITIMAPDSAIVKTMDLGVMKDVSVKKGDDYYIQIYASEASTNDLARVKADQLAEVKKNPYFSKIIEEEETGFIYEMVYDSLNTYYGFRHIRLQGDKEFIFQTGLVGMFSLEDAKQMFEAVKPQGE